MKRGGASPEEVEKGDEEVKESKLTPEQEDQAEYWLKMYPEVVIAPEDRRECGPEVAELEELLASFETQHSLEELLLIVDLTPEEAFEHTLREAAKSALIPIVELMNKLKEETDISDEDHDALKAKYRRFSQAVGIMHNNKLDHTR